MNPLKTRAACSAWLALVLQVGCAQSGSLPEPAAEHTVPQFDGKPKMLAIVGYNYTDLYIDSFSVGSSGGGNLFVSSPTSGGGSSSCCLILYPGVTLPRPVTIEWMRSLDGKRQRWCQQTVQLTGPIPENPTAFGVHFMPDGEIQVEVTQGYPKLKLRLDNYNDGHRKAEGNVIHDEEKAVCKDGR